MPVRVIWDDESEQRFPEAIRIEQATPRAPYYLMNDQNKYVALIPDFGVRALIREDPSRVMAD